MKELGFTIDRWETGGGPVLFCQNCNAGPNQPTLLLYTHYDVQPIDPLELWTSPPFEPTIRDGEIYARGACDDKGLTFYTMKALQALIARDGKLPINVKWVIEGEEEIGSPGLKKIVASKARELKADYLVVVDVGIPEKNTPAVTLGVRGLVTFTVTVEGSSTDLHSGMLGGMVYNPIHALVEVLAKARDKDGHIVIPGFYDGVPNLTKEEEDSLALDLFNEKEFNRDFGAQPVGGERALPPLVRNWLRPTLEVNGIEGGYHGPGFKTVIPAKAMAKVSCRLVGNQNPEKISNAVKEFFLKNCPNGLKMDVFIHPGAGVASITSPNATVVQAFAQSFSEVFGKPCLNVMCGGSIPVTAELAKASGAEVVWVGLGMDSDKIHAPNEHFGIDRLEKGFLTMARGIELLRK